MSVRHVASIPRTAVGGTRKAPTE